MGGIRVRWRMIQILAFTDIIAGFMLFATSFGWEIPIGMLIFFGILLMGKALLSIYNWFGWIDIIAFVFLIVGIFIVIPEISALLIATKIIGTIMLIKGIYSLV